MMLVPAEVIIILSIIVVIIFMLFYFIYSGFITSTYSFKLAFPLANILDVVKNIQEYEKWWNKFDNYYLYKVKQVTFQNDTSSTVRVVLYIYSNSSKEVWNIILNEGYLNTSVVVMQDIKLLSKIQRIFKNTWSYKKDLVMFKRNLEKILKSTDSITN
ncbi:hypothetical protein ACFX5K_05955 [Rickettsiales bacterium LUAb2]